MFVTHGIPEVVFDNGTDFISDEFKSFIKLNGIGHVRSAPYCLSTNGLTEYAIWAANTPRELKE